MLRTVEFVQDVVTAHVLTVRRAPPVRQTVALVLIPVGMGYVVPQNPVLTVPLIVEGALVPVAMVIVIPRSHVIPVPRIVEFVQDVVMVGVMILQKTVPTVP